LFAPFDFDFVVEEFLSIDDGQAALFSLRGIDQHPFHDAFLLLSALAPVQKNVCCLEPVYTTGLEFFENLKASVAGADA
jgi:hypothetical protein